MEETPQERKGWLVRSYEYVPADEVREFNHKNFKLRNHNVPFSISLFLEFGGVSTASEPMLHKLKLVLI